MFTLPADERGLLEVVAGLAVIAAIVLEFWLVTEISFLPPNHFGPDPLGTLKSEAQR